jgi:ABC-type phosphate/phosphonate transport system substrate-binding protein
MNRRKIVLGAVLTLSLATPAIAADYTLSVEPNYPPAQAQQVYRPLLDYLGKSTGHRFILKPSANYHVFWRDMRTGVKVDFAFAEAHFTEYRINRQKFVPLARVAESTHFVLLADASRESGGTNGLIGDRIVSMSSPSMGNLLLGELYPNPLAQPEIQSVAQTWRDGVEMVFAGETDAAMVPNYIAREYPNLVALHTSRDFAARAFSAAPTVPADVRKKVADALLRLHRDSSLNEVLVELGTTQFVPANTSDYAGSERLLRGVFGYVPLAPRPAAPATAPAKPAAAPAKPAAAAKEPAANLR